MRLTKLRNKMTELSVDAVLVLDELNQHYLSEFAFTDGFLFVSGEKAYLLYFLLLYSVSVKFNIYSLPHFSQIKVYCFFAFNLFGFAMQYFSWTNNCPLFPFITLPQYLQIILFFFIYK